MARSGYDASLAARRGEIGRGCHSINRRRKGRGDPCAEVALLLLPMVSTTIPHTFGLIGILQEDASGKAVSSVL